MGLTPIADRKTDAQGNKQTGSSRVIEGVRFYSWRVGINRYEARTEDQRIRMSSTYRYTGYNIAVDGERLPKTYRFERTAVRDALKRQSEIDARRTSE